VFILRCFHNSKLVMMPKILLLGDSLTQTSFEGWGASLANQYQRRADVINRGMSGYNTRWYLRYAQDVGMFSDKVDEDVILVTLFFGANDSALKDLDAKHVPVPEYEENLTAMLQNVTQCFPKANVLLIAPPPVHKGQRLDFQKQRYGDKATGIPERTFEHTQLYAQACMKVAARNKIPCVDMFTAMVEAGDQNEGFGRFLSDGLHFSPQGHAFVTEHVLKCIEANFPDIAVTPCPVTGQPNNSGSKCPGLETSGPYHDDINHNEWEKAFDERKTGHK
jgi:lysophospholipase L1-like esterase